MFKKVFSIFLLFLLTACSYQVKLSFKDDIEEIQEQQIALYRDDCIQNLYFDAINNPDILKKSDKELGELYFKFFSDKDQIIYVQQARNLVKNKDGD